MKKAKIMAILMTLGLMIICVATIATVPSNPAEGSIAQNQSTEEISITESQIEKYRITDSSEGEQLAQEAISRWKQNEFCLPCLDIQDIEVYKFAEGDFLIVPSSSEIKVEYTGLKDGSIRVEPSVAVGLKSNLQCIEETNERTVSDTQTRSMYWGLWYQNCYTRIENSYGWIDHCILVQKLYGETDPNKDYYNLQHYATAKSKGIYVLKTAYINCWKHEYSSPMQWVDWSPRSDMQVGYCQQYTLGVTALGLLASTTQTICETWDITKYSEAGKFKNTWRGSVRQSEREVAYMIAVSIPQNGEPGWWVQAGYTCSPF